MISVKLPDGTTAQFPDGTPPEQIKAAIQKKFPPTGNTQPAGQPLAQRFAGQQPSANIEDQTQPRPDLYSSTMATANGLAASVPGLQQTTDALMGLGGMAFGKPYDQTVHGLQQRRAQLAQQAPLARLAGEAAPVMLAPALAPEAMGMAGSLGKRLANSAMSMAGYEGTQALANGKRGDAVLGAMAEGGAGGAGGALVGRGLEKFGEGLANTFTRGAQRRVTDAAIAGAPAAGALKADAKAAFDTATGGADVPAVTAPAYDRLVGAIAQATVKIRPNSANDPQAVGLLQHMMELAQAAKTQGVVVDLKDLHLARQLAQKVAQSSNGRDSAIGSIVIGKIDDFVKTLKPADVLGGGDPSQAANALLKGISTWNRAQKVATIQIAVDAADTYKSGFENGLKLSFLKLMKSPDFARYSRAEQDAIREVAKGTTRQNIASLFGKLGINLGDGAHNVLGAGLGTTALTGVLTPALGPMALPAALTATTIAGAAGRRIASKAAQSSADRAAQVMATPGIPSIPQAPNLLGPGRVPLETLLRGGTAVGMSNSR